METRMARRALKAVFASGASITTLAFALASPGLADAQAANAASTSQLQEVVVTASRVTRGGFTAPTPTTVVGVETFQARAATTVSDVLYELPAIRPAPAGTGVSQAAGNFINLRGFGQNRTLVLVDGHRFVPSNPGSAGAGDSVDSNVVPEGLVERVDVVTGGASAAWGSDAVTGVVNIVLKHSLQGIRGDIQYGQSGHGDAKNISANLSGGTSFAQGRGQLIVAGEYSNRYDLPTYGDRSWSNGHCGFDTSKTRPVNGVTYGAVPVCGLTLSGYTNGGVIVASNNAPLAVGNPLRGRQFLSSTTSSPYNYGTLLGNSVMIGGDGGWIGTTASPVSPLERKNIYARASYEFSPSLTGYLEGSYAVSGTKFDLFVNSVASSTDTPILINSGNPYIPADIQAIMTANKIASFSLDRIAPELGTAHTNSENQISRVVGGLDGKFNEVWKWNAYFTFGRTHFDTHYTNNIIESNLRAALDVVVNPTTGKPDCRINVAGPAAPGTPAYGAQSGCTPANPFGPGSLANVRGYVTGDLDNLVRMDQEAGGATIQGEPFQTWAGPVSLVGGVEGRREVLSQKVSPYSDFLNPPAFGSGGFQQANPKSFNGAITVYEGFAETVVPLLINQPLVKSLDFNAAIRETNYSTSGNVTTWKAGLTWHPTSNLLFRAVQSRDIRAAALFEQFGSSVTYGAVVDRTTGGASVGSINFTAISLGNPSLKPESADTTTLGVSWTNVIDGLSFSVDAYKINLTQAIGQLGTQGIIDACYGGGTAAGLAPDAVKCALINRASGIIFNQWLNLGTIYSTGADIEASYRLPLSKLSEQIPGALTFRLLSNYTQHLRINTNGLLTVERAGDEAGTPTWKSNFTIAYNNGPLILNAQARYIGRMNRDVTQVPGYFLEPVVPSIVYVNLSGQYVIRNMGTQRVELYATINNLLDRQPPFVPSVTGVNAAGAGQGGGSTNNTFYDGIGRAFIVGARFAF